LRLATEKTKSLWDRLTTSEEERIIIKIVDKLKVDKETDEIIVKSIENYRKTYHVIKKRARRKAK